MKELEYKIGEIFYKNPVYRILISFLLASPFGYITYLTKGSAVAIIVFGLIQISSNFFLLRFSKKYIFIRKSMWLLSLYDKTKLSEKELSEIIANVLTSTLKRLIAENILLTEENTVEIFKEEFIHEYSLKLNLNQFNDIKNSLKEYPESVHSFVKGS